MTITMRFDKVVTNPFASIISSTLIRELAEVQKRWADKLVVKFQKYPPERPGQLYIRTFTLQAAWNIEGPQFTGGDMVTTVFNDAEDKRGRDYAQYVVGNDIGDMQNQAYHAGRWSLFRKEVELSEAELIREAQEVINRNLAPAIITP